MKHEFEMVSHELGEYHIFLVNLLYRTPHIHRDFEICWILSGDIWVDFSGERLCLGTNDVFIANPYAIHELCADAPVLILSVQVSPSFFAACLPEIEQFVFASHKLPERAAKKICPQLRQLALEHLNRPPLYELDCAAKTMRLFHTLFQEVPYSRHTENEIVISQRKGDRMRSIINYIDTHYNEKLLLSHLAERENLSLHYLSHLFCDSMGVSFQEYLSRVRCEHARRLLISSDCSLLDVALSCGFSDPKYFNRHFHQQFGCSPKEYRKQEQIANRHNGQPSSRTAQVFLSYDESLRVLSSEL